MTNIMHLKFTLLALAFVAVVGVGSVSAQHHVGVRAGYGMGTIGRIQPAESTGMLWGLKSGGVSYKYYGALDRFANGVQIDLQYLEKGFKRQNMYHPDVVGDSMTYIRRLNSIEIPILWHPYFTFFKDRLGVFMNIGVNISYNINSTYEWRYANGDSLYSHGAYEMKLIRDNRWSYGLVGGFGINYMSGPHEFYFEGRYYIGYSDILKNRTVNPDNPRQSPLDAMNFSVGYFYRLGGGVREKKKSVERPPEPMIPLMPVEGAASERALPEPMAAEQILEVGQSVDEPDSADTVDDEEVAEVVESLVVE